MKLRRCAPALRPPAALLTAALAAACALGCEHRAAVAPPPAAPPPPPPAPPPRAHTPLPLPDDLLLVGRWRRPTLLLQQLENWSHGDLTLELWLRGRVGRPSRPVDLEAPIEFFALWDGKAEPPVLRWALSLALVADPRAAPALDPRDVPSPIGLHCAEDAALGPASLRMVCSSSDGDLEQLLPLATRALPLAELGGGELAVRLEARPLRGVEDAQLEARASAWLASAFGLDALNRRGEAELAGLAQSLRDELRNLAEDLDGVSLELATHDAQSLELSVVAPRAMARSELLQLLIGSGAAGIAPVDFWQLQRESEHAGFLWAWNTLPLARLRTPFAALLAALLDFRGLPDRLAEQGRLLIERLPLPSGPVVHAAGRLPTSSDARNAPPPWLAELGWEAYGFAGNFADYDAWAERLADAINDPVLGPQFGRLLRSAAGPRWVPQHIKRRKPSGGQRWPKGSFLLELELALPREAEAEPTGEHAGAQRSSPPTLFVLCVPEPDGVKVAWAADEKFLLTLAAPVARRAGSSTLEARAGLGRLNEQRTLAGGFSSLAALAGASAGQWSLGEQAGSVDVTPHHGLTPILYRVSQRSDVPALAFSASVGRDTVEDLLFLIANEAPQP